ncbi:MAG: hypothetical protein ABIK09_07075 [Pseudomonadota bacterium]
MVQDRTSPGRLAARAPLAAGLLAGCWQLLRLPGAPSDPAQWLIAAEAILCAALLAGIVIHLLLLAPRGLQALRERPVPGLPILALAVAAFALRALLPPIFLHVEFVGLKYWSLAVDPSLLYDQDPSFGRGGLLTQGVLSSILGGGLRAFFFGDALLSAATVGLGGLLVARWSTERSLAPVVAAGLLAVHPLLVRVGASEDVHVAAGFWAFLSLALLERHRSGRRDGDLLAAVGAAILATCSRQFLLPMPLLFGLLWLERVPGPRLGRRPLAWAGLALLVATAALKWAVLLPEILAAGTGIQHGSGAGLSPILRSAGILAMSSLTEPHPLLDQWLTPAPVLLLMLWGLLRAGRGGLPRTMLLAWAWLFLLSLPLGYWGISVRYLFRSLLILVSLLAAGTGLGDLLPRLHAVRPWIPAAVAALLLVLVTALAAPRIEREAPMDPFTRQAFWLEAVLPTLPEGAIILTASSGDLGTPNLYLKIPDRLLNPRGDEGRSPRPLALWPALDGVDDATPVVLFHGVACHSVSVFELEEDWSEPDRLIRDADEDGLRRITHAAHPGDPWIRAHREACRPQNLPAPRPEDPGLAIPGSGLRYGNLHYEVAPFRIGLRRLR